MTAVIRCAALFLVSALLAAGVSGCGTQPRDGEAAWQDEVDSSLERLEEQHAFRYRTHLETLIGVSGQSVYGDEKGEGSFLEGDFSVSITRTSPEGEQDLVLASVVEEFLLQEGDAWRPVTAQDIPSPLYDPRYLLELVSSFGSVALEGEEERGGEICERYLLQLGSGKAREAVNERAWSYFSSLDYELNCRLWIAEVSAPPVCLRLEVAGFDPQESLQRYRVVFTMEPYDLGSPDIRLDIPQEAART